MPIKTMVEYLKLAVAEVKVICELYKIPDDHGFPHAVAVMRNAYECVKELKLTSWRALTVLIAALCHDIDDHKFFPGTGYSNVSRVIKVCDLGFFALSIIRMIDLVSFSTYGNNTDGAELWQLIPRHADRIEAVGKIGLVRCLEYNERLNRPLFTDETPRIANMIELWHVAIPRLANYVAKRGKVGESSLLDHCFDSLCHRGVPSGIKFIDNIAGPRMQAVYELMLEFGRTGVITREQILEL
jgi:uncharacterized protein